MKRSLATLRLLVCALTLSIMTVAPASADLVGFWNFDDESADDLSGNENHGEIGAVEFSDESAPGTDGMSVEFFGSERIQIPHSDSLDFGDALTVALWMKADNFEQPSDWNGPIGKISDPREDGGWELQRFGAESRIDLRIDTSEQSNAVVGNLVGTFEDEWVHVAWTAEEGEWTSYLDGEFANSGIYSHGDGFANEGDLFFGNRANCCFYIGLLDEIGIWDHALSEEEIADLAKGISPVDMVAPGPPGDFDADDDLDANDVNALITAMNGDMNSQFDVTGDGSVNAADLTHWVNELRGTWVGDANLDGEFNSSDFVAVFTTAKYETGQPATWDEGDWNGDGVFSSSDFVAAFGEGGYERGVRGAAANAVPEPTSTFTCVFGVILLIRAARRR